MPAAGEGTEGCAEAAEYGDVSEACGSTRLNAEYSGDVGDDSPLARARDVSAEEIEDGEWTDAPESTRSKSGEIYFD